MATWIAFEHTVPVSELAGRIPELPGKYAIFVEDELLLPTSFAQEAASRREPRLLYIGKADVTLAKRVYDEECQHRRPGTFFRSVGAMLGFRSPKGGRNYEFGRDDKQKVINWIARHLRVSWSVEIVDGSHRSSEQALIREFEPLLNLQGNPSKFSELSRLRALCRKGSGA